MTNLRQGDIVIVDAEPHAGHEMGGHDPKNGNNRRHYLVISQLSYNRKSKLFLGLAITHNHVDSPFRYHIVDYMSKTNGDALLLQLLAYDFDARNGELVGHLNDHKQLEQIRKSVQQIFNHE